MAKKPALPAIESMTPTEMVVEIIKRGWEIKECEWLKGPCIYRAGSSPKNFSGQPFTLADALAYTRKLDGEA